MYENFEDDITECKSCDTYPTIEEFNNCMAEVRSNMIQNITEEIEPKVDGFISSLCNK